MFARVTIPYKKFFVAIVVFVVVFSFTSLAFLVTISTFTFTAAINYFLKSASALSDIILLYLIKCTCSKGCYKELQFPIA